MFSCSGCCVSMAGSPPGEYIENEKESSDVDGQTTLLEVQIREEERDTITQERGTSEN